MAQLSSLHFWNQLNRCQVQKQQVRRTSSASKLNSKFKVFYAKDQTPQSCLVPWQENSRQKAGIAHILWPVCVRIKNPYQTKYLNQRSNRKILSKQIQNCHILCSLKQVLTFKHGFVQWIWSVSPWICVICCALEHLSSVWSWWDTSSSKSTTQPRSHWTFYPLIFK